jgi:hypothetical protein
MLKLKIFNNSPTFTCTNLGSQKSRGKNIIILKISMWMHIKYVIN